LGKFIHSKGINREIKGIDYLYRQGTILMSDTGDKGTNFHFNESELDLLADTTFLTAKRKLTEKIIARFGELVTVYNEVIIPYSGKLPPESLVRNGKIRTTLLLLVRMVSLRFAPCSGGEIHFR
jgi:hypothetical protein